MPIVFIIFLLTCSYGEDFITPMEYAKMLYQNPRGIGCHKCHGLEGQGKIIAHYKSKGKKKSLKAPPINNISKQKFIDALEEGKGIMPRYFLTKYEAESLYYYVRLYKKEKK